MFNETQNPLLESRASNVFPCERGNRTKCIWKNARGKKNWLWMCQSNGIHSLFVYSRRAFIELKSFFFHVHRFWQTENDCSRSFASSRDKFQSNWIYLNCMEFTRMSGAHHICSTIRTPVPMAVAIHTPGPGILRTMIPKREKWNAGINIVDSTIAIIWSSRWRMPWWRARTLARSHARTS